MVNSQTDEQLTRLLVMLQTGGTLPNDLRHWWIDALGRYLEGEGATLDSCLMVNGQGAKRRMTEHLVRAAEALGCDLSAWDKAAMLSQAIRRFRRTWPRVRSHNAPPAHFDAVQHSLWKAFRQTGGDVPDSPRHLFRLLT